VVAALILAWAAAPAAAHRRSKPTAGEAMLFRSPVLLALGFATVMAFLAEGTMESWSAIYLRGSLGLPLLLGSTGPALFHAAMCAGRLGAASVIGGFGRRTTLGIAGFAVALGMGVALATTMPPAVLVGLAIVGLSLSAVAPVTLSLAGDAGGRRSGQASAVITTIGYAGFLIGPALVGGIAEATTLRLALGSVIVAGMAILAVAAWIHPARRRAAAAETSRLSEDSQEPGSE
jgi:MFS family permease